MSNITKSLTEIEKAELLLACKKALTVKGILLLRRLMYELDTFKDKMNEKEQKS